MNPRTLSLSIDNLSCDIIVPQNGKVNDCFSLASMIRGSKTQRGSGNTVNLLEDIDMVFQFFSGSRHLGFEDVQAMVHLISDARQISGLLTLCTLCNTSVDCCTNLHQVCILSRNPLTSSGFTRQSVEAYAIRRCNEASSLTSNEVSFYCFPVYSQGFRHKASLSSIVHKVKASMIPRFEDAPTHNQRSN